MSNVYPVVTSSGVDISPGSSIGTTASMEQLQNIPDYDVELKLKDGVTQSPDGLSFDDGLDLVRNGLEIDRQASVDANMQSMKDAFAEGHYGDATKDALDVARHAFMGFLGG